MSVLFVALPVAIMLAMVSVIAFAWAVREGQFDDLDSPSLRAVNDD